MNGSNSPTDVYTAQDAVELSAGEAITKAELLLPVPSSSLQSEQPLPESLVHKLAGLSLGPGARTGQDTVATPEQLQEEGQDPEKTLDEIVVQSGPYSVESSLNGATLLSSFVDGPFVNTLEASIEVASSPASDAPSCDDDKIEDGNNPDPSSYLEILPGRVEANLPQAAAETDYDVPQLDNHPPSPIIDVSSSDDNTPSSPFPVSPSLGTSRPRSYSDWSGLPENISHEGILHQFLHTAESFSTAGGRDLLETQANIYDQIFKIFFSSECKCKEHTMLACYY